ncbi:hypothetical protein AVEN_16958-1 [Araneus ventricosus]|uniref:Uncharacterized protein n=1 Tax=Araneus ventricosus TaxID=182803 RepID=A0A4Y2D4J1_ARAVE|nr:hypothetical protein AVEN_16958-1 [Araneus ventricosus]
MEGSPILKSGPHEMGAQFSSVMCSLPPAGGGTVGCGDARDNRIFKIMQEIKHNSSREDVVTVSDDQSFGLGWGAGLKDRFH